MAAPKKFLVCACGRFAGPSASVYGHRGPSKNAACKSGDTIEVSEDAAREIMAEVERENRQAADDAARTARQADDDAARTARDQERNSKRRPGGHAGGPKPAQPEGLSTDNAPPVARVPIPMSAERQLAPAEPVTVTVTLRLKTETIALYDGSRTNPELGFEGTISDWVDQVAKAFYESIGMDAGLRWRVPVRMEATA